MLGASLAASNKLGSPRWFFSDLFVGYLLRLVRHVVAVGAIWGLAYAPADYQQGNSFRIMYVHVPAAMPACGFYIGMGVAGFIVGQAHKLTDVAISACLPLGMVITALALFSGSVWGRPTWGSWWSGWADCIHLGAVLFVCWYFALREAIAEAELRAWASALIALVGTVNIPIIKYSVEWWNTLHQPVSFGLTQKPTMPSEMWLPLLVMVLGFYCFAGFIVLLRRQ